MSAPRQATRPSSRAAQRLVRHIVGGWRCQAIHAAVQLGLPEALRDGARSPADLAVALACDVDALARLLRALCTLGLARARADGRFGLTAGGRLLCAAPDGNAPGLRALAMWWGGPLWPMWGELAYSVRTGRSAREKLTGDTGYSYLDPGGAMAQMFHDAQAELTALMLGDLVRWPGWTAARRVVDVGGGHGQVALGLLAAHPELSACVLDLPHAAAGARQCIERAGMGARCSFEPGTFFDPLPGGADVYVLKSILHNWSDVRCACILARCAQAMAGQGRLLIVERVLAPQPGVGARDQAAARTDLNMLAGLGGRERTLGQFTALLEAAGFQVERTQATGFEFSLIEARPVLPAAAVGAT